MIIDDKSGVGFKIGALWAFVAVHDDGDEGIIGFLSPSGWVPMVAADQTRLDLLIPRARAVAKEGNKVVRLVRFDTRADVEVFHPDGRRERST
jgi:hypothetical protein